jgi:hypothetical protein
LVLCSKANIGRRAIDQTSASADENGMGEPPPKFAYIRFRRKQLLSLLRTAAFLSLALLG